MKVRQELYGKKEQSYPWDSSPVGISTGCLHLQVVFCTLLSIKVLVIKWDWWIQDFLIGSICLSLWKDFPDSTHEHAGICFLWRQWCFSQVPPRTCTTKERTFATSGEHFTLWAIHCTARTVCGKMYPPIKPGDNNNNTTILITIPSPAFDFITFPLPQIHFRDKFKGGFLCTGFYS